jgi:hypothetical protein
MWYVASEARRSTVSVIYVVDIDRTGTLLNDFKRDANSCGVRIVQDHVIPRHNQ